MDLFIPNWYQLISAIGLTVGFWLDAKIIYMIKYELIYYRGAGEDYLKYGKSHFKGMKKKSIAGEFIKLCHKEYNP